MHNVETEQVGLHFHVPRGLQIELLRFSDYLQEWQLWLLFLAIIIPQIPHAVTIFHRGYGFDNLLALDVKDWRQTCPSAAWNELAGSKGGVTKIILKAYHPFWSIVAKTLFEG